MNDQIKEHGTFVIQYIRDGVLYATNDHWVFTSKDKGSTWRKLCRLPSKKNSLISRIIDWTLRTHIVRYFRRNIGIHTLVVLKNGTVLIQYDGIYRFDGKGKFAQKVFQFSTEQISGPLKNGMAVDESTGNVYFGEYQNKRPYAVRVFRGSEDGTKWEECYRFPEGRIKHIHSIVPDKFRERLWVCSGDNDSECGLFYTDDDFSTVHLFKGGDQSWRMVSLIPLEHSLIWGSDAGQDAPAEAVNYIYAWDFRENRKKKLTCIDKPAYYSTVLENGTMIIGTHFEPLLKRNVSKCAELWMSNNGNTWTSIAEFEYELSSRKVGTKYASLYLALGDGSSDILFFTPLNIKNNDYQLLSYKV